MAEYGRSLAQEVQHLTAKVKTLLNAELKDICRGESLQVSGVKAALQKRIIDRLESCARAGATARVAELGYRIEHGGKEPPPPKAHNQAPIPAQVTASSPHHAPYKEVTNGYPGSTPESLPMRSRQSMYSSEYRLGRCFIWNGAKLKLVQARLLFKESPFYEILGPLTQTAGLAVIPQNRQSTHLTLPLSQHHVEHINADSSYRVMLYGAVDSGMGPYARCEVTFPHQIEVKVNGEEVKANYKGLKNKLGSVRPVDITNFVRKAPEYANRISVTYALTTKKYFVLAQFVRKHSVEELTERISKSRAIRADAVVREMINKANDADIVATSTVMSLKDPISTLRIRTPCRSSVCSHNQCFDAGYFLELQEQAPTWTCPVCNKIVSYESLAVDQYVKNILDSVSSSVEQVTIEPDGSWSQGIAESTKSKREGRRSSPDEGAGNDDDGDDIDSDDLIDITDSRINAIKSENPPDSHLTLARTPPLSSREASTTGSTHRPGGAVTAASTSKKRNRDVIDLTLSDSDNDGASGPPPAKRPAYSTPNSLPNPMRNSTGNIRLPPRPPSHTPYPNGQNLQHYYHTTNHNHHYYTSQDTPPATCPSTIAPFRINSVPIPLSQHNSASNVFPSASVSTPTAAAGTASQGGPGPPQMPNMTRTRPPIFGSPSQLGITPLPPEVIPPLNGYPQGSIPGYGSSSTP